MDVDALVIGGGPGGSAAAYHLARGGARVVLAERSGYPRDKVCGDGLTPRAVRSLDAMGLADMYAGWSRSSGLRVHGGRIVIELPWPEVGGFPGFGLARPRMDFDQLLARHAAGAGAELWERAEVVRPLFGGGVVAGAVVRRDGGEDAVRAPVVVAADGAPSRFALALGLRRDPGRPIGVAIRQYVRTAHDTDPWLESYLELRRGPTLLPGYGWIFPLTGGVVNVGLGLLSTSLGFGETNYRRLLESWLPTAGADWGFRPHDVLGSARSAPLPMGGSRHPVLWRGVMFVGDAAGMVNPFNGEGIDYALEAGEVAAAAGLEVLRTGNRAALRGYQEAVRQRFGSYFTLGRLFVRAIGHPWVMRVATTYGLSRPALMHLVLKLMSNLYEPHRGDLADHVVRALVRMAPAT